MEKNVMIAIPVAIIFFVLVLNFSGLLWGLNIYFELKDPDISCNIDSDCRLFVQSENTQCLICDSCETFNINDSEVIAINKNQRLSCPFSKPLGVGCAACIGTIKGSVKLKCIENTCQKILG